MILNLFLCHPKVDVSYDPILDGYACSKIGSPKLDVSEHSFKSSESECFVQSKSG